MSRWLQVALFPIFLMLVSVPFYFETYLSDFFYLTLSFVFSGIYSVIVILACKSGVSKG